MIQRRRAESILHFWFAPEPGSEAGLYQLRWFVSSPEFDGLCKARFRIRAYKAAGVTTLRVAPEGRDLAEKLTTLGRVVEPVRAAELGRLS